MREPTRAAVRNRAPILMKNQTKAQKPIPMSVITTPWLVNDETSRDAPEAFDESAASCIAVLSDGEDRPPHHNNCYHEEACDDDTHEVVHRYS